MESAQVLVLNAGYQPTGRTSWQVVVGWLAKQIIERESIVEVVEEYDREVHSVNWTVKIPSVVRLLKPVRKKRAVKFSRHGVYARDNGRCQYCWKRLSTREATYDHVIPRAQGGTTCWENIVICCQIDNQRKAHHTPEQVGLKLRSKPVRPKSLPQTGQPIYFQDGMPDSWRAWLRDEAYWNGALEEG